MKKQTVKLTNSPRSAIRYSEQFFLFTKHWTQQLWSNYRNA